MNGSDYEFVNPYNFVPLHTNPSRQEDGTPKSASRWHEELYTGRLKVIMKAETPLLPIVRVREATKETPALLTVRRGPDGMPAINGSSIKGMLRSLYEQATGSRLGVFDHAKPLTYRSSTDGARTLVLAKVTENNQAHLTIATSTGIEHKVGKSWRTNPVLVPMDECQHIPFGQEVFVWLQLCSKDRQRAWLPCSSYSESEDDATKSDKYQPPLEGWRAKPQKVLVQGCLHNTGHSFHGKKYERFFVEKVIKSEVSDAYETGEVIILTGNDRKLLEEQWRYRLDSFTGRPGTTPSKEELSVAPYAKIENQEIHKRWKQLKKGQTLFVRTTGDGDSRTITDLYPGMVTREIDNASPEDLLPKKFRAPASPDQFSPADRVFGRVNEKRGADGFAHRAQLTVGGIICTSEDPILDFAAYPQHLAPLGTPKESQARFYTRSINGQTLKDAERKDAFDPQRHILAGHKVYPHHGRFPEGYWSTPSKTWRSDSDGKHPEVDGKPKVYLAAEGTKAQTSSEIDSWVKPDSTFSFNLTFENLSSQELGALLWIIELDGRAGHHRLGHGKPLGFGSVSLSIEWDESAVRSNEQMIDRYRSSHVDERLSESDCTRLSKKFDDDFRTHEPKVYCSMVKAHKGFSGDSPVHYPWVTPAEPQAETFQWFTSNERGEPIPGRSGKYKNPNRYALPLLYRSTDPDLSKDPTLPALEPRSDTTRVRTVPPQLS
ncbi:MAG: TIGR03986 family CRISPR-associated RAMP protein [Ancrocorticia sp.]